MGHRIFGQLFLSIGAMKAGTTWLYTLLARHPQLQFTPQKELHYFHHCYVNTGYLSEARRVALVQQRFLRSIDPERGQIEAVRRNLHWAGQYLSGPVNDAWFRGLFFMAPDHWACEFSNLSAHLPQEAWPEISGKCHKLRVLYTMREPLKRLWTHVAFQLQATRQLEQSRDWSPEDWVQFTRQPHIWDNAEYGAVLRRMRAGLGDDDYMVLFFEDLETDRRGTLARIENFLELLPFDYPDTVLARPVVEPPALDMPDVFPDLFADDLARIRDEVAQEGFDIPPGWTG